MDDPGFYVPFISISGISGWWKDEHEGICTKVSIAYVRKQILPPVGFEPETPWLEVRSANHLAMQILKNGWDTKFEYSYFRDYTSDIAQVTKTMCKLFKEPIYSFYSQALSGPLCRLDALFNWF